MLRVSCLLISLLPAILGAQSYTSWRTGAAGDREAMAQGGICLMGGGGESDEGMRWFLQRAGGGDVLVLRTSGADGYNAYLFDGLGVRLNSVETILCHDRSAAYDPYVLDRLRQAEAVWFAGGDQSTYVQMWRGTALDSLLDRGVRERRMVVGGTSAGLAIQGEFYFSAERGTVTSAEALADPYDPKVAVDAAPFLRHSLLQGVITDSHFAERGREGRTVVFLARIHTDQGRKARAIACDERTAVCIDTEGHARVFGDGKGERGNAWFILSGEGPESCVPGSPLTWHRGGRALEVFRVQGTPAGLGGLDLRDWRTGTGGTRQHWSVRNGTLEMEDQ